MESTGIVGKPKAGYGLRELMQGIAGFLGCNNTKHAFLAGAGEPGKRARTCATYDA
jgi:NADH/NAD ratio-sensing transcriptional regulator Rex